MLFSAQTGEGLDELLVDRIAREAAATDVLLSADIPYRAGALITLVHEQGTLLHEEYLEGGVAYCCEAAGSYRAAAQALSHRVDELQKAQNNGLMQQIKGECMTSKAGERRDGIGVGPAWDGLIDSLRYVCGRVYPARYIKKNGMMG